MKVHGHHPHPVHAAPMRPHAKAGREATEPTATAAPAPTVPPAATAPATPIDAPTTGAPAESTVAMASRKLPPGLVRVAARFEAMGVEGRTAGQSHVLAQIQRNLQRYADMQGITMTPPAAPATEPGATTTPAPDATAPTTPADGSTAPTEPTAPTDATGTPPASSTPPLAPADADAFDTLLSSATLEAEDDDAAEPAAA